MKIRAIVIMTYIGNVDRYHYVDRGGGSFSSSVLVHVGALCRFVTVFCHLLLDVSIVGATVTNLITVVLDLQGNFCCGPSLPAVVGVDRCESSVCATKGR